MLNYFSRLAVSERIRLKGGVDDSCAFSDWDTKHGGYTCYIEKDSNEEVSVELDLMGLEASRVGVGPGGAHGLAAGGPSWGTLSSVSGEVRTFERIHQAFSFSC